MFYILGVKRPMNIAKQADVYWIAWEFLWSWLLLPFFPLAEITKKMTADVFIANVAAGETDTFTADANFPETASLECRTDNILETEKSPSIARKCYNMYKPIILFTFCISIVWITLFTCYSDIFKFLYGTSKNLTEEKLSQTIEMLRVITPFKTTH